MDYQQQNYGQPNYGQQPYGQPQPYADSAFNNPVNCGPTGKSRGIFCLLALVLGSIGLHYFYAGKAAGGIITILLTLITCGAWAIIPLLQGIIILWNQSNEEFYYKFVASNSTFPLF